MITLCCLENDNKTSVHVQYRHHFLPHNFNPWLSESTDVEAMETANVIHIIINEHALKTNSAM
jgi:hypothetical protein